MVIGYLLVFLTLIVIIHSFLSSFSLSQRLLFICSPNTFSDRDGKYFKYILEFLRTDDIVIPEIFHDSVLREAEFYGIKLPLSESSPYLMYV